MVSFLSVSRYLSKQTQYFFKISNLRVQIIGSLLLTLALVGCANPVGSTSTDLSGKITVVGSTALQPLATQAAALFQKQHTQVHIDVSGGGSLLGIKSVSNGQSDIGDSDVYADPAVFPDPNLTDHIVCVIPFTMIVAPGINVTTLSQQQIIDIFSTGKIHNWMDVGGPNMPIVPVVRPATSGTRATFRKYILGGRDEKGTLLKTDSSTTVRDTVAQTPGAIGYLALSVIDPSVHQVAIDGQLPTAQNIESGRYSFWGYEHMYTLGDNNPISSAFLDFMLTAEIQKLAEKLSYIPIANMQLPQVTVPQRNPISITVTQPQMVRREDKRLENV